MTEVWAALSAYEGEFDLEKENCILISSGKNWMEQDGKGPAFGSEQASWRCEGSGASGPASRADSCGNRCPQQGSIISPFTWK